MLVRTVSQDYIRKLVGNEAERASHILFFCILDWRVSN